MMKMPLASELRAPAHFVPIAALTRRLGITARALRHYQDQGLIRSHRIARNSRAYDLDTVAMIETIVALRDVDLPLAAIREILAQQADPQAQALALRAALIQARADLHRQIAKIDNMLAGTTTPASAAPRAPSKAFSAPVRTPHQADVGL